MLTATQPHVDPNSIYSPTATAKILNVNPSTLYRWQQAGRIIARTHKGTLKTVYLGRDILKFWTQYI